MQVALVSGAGQDRRRRWCQATVYGFSLVRRQCLRYGGRTDASPTGVDQPILVHGCVGYQGWETSIDCQPWCKQVLRLTATRTRMHTADDTNSGSIRMGQILAVNAGWLDAQLSSARLSSARDRSSLNRSCRFKRGTQPRDAQEQRPVLQFLNWGVRAKNLCARCWVTYAELQLHGSAFDLR
jgi:hypothetical protein